jgi:hypothetical protein
VLSANITGAAYAACGDDEWEDQQKWWVEADEQRERERERKRERERES